MPTDTPDSAPLLAQLPANTVGGKFTFGQRIAQYILIVVLVVLGAWTLRRFMPALAWAVILGIATWPLYSKWSAWLHRRTDQLWPALSFTCIVGLVLIVPLAWGAIVAAREAFVLLRHFTEGSARELAMPQWLVQIPWLAEPVKEFWQENVAPNGGLAHPLTQPHSSVMAWSRLLGLQLIRRVVTFGFTLLILFFVYLHGLALAENVKRLCQRLFGEAVLPLLTHSVVAIRATVDGVVLVAVAEGAFMSAVYAFMGVAHPILFGSITGILAMVPFAAPVAFGAVAIGLAMQGSIGAAIAIVTIGSILLFVVDHFVRPIIIGDAARLPFLWVLLGILGGIESFGLIGLFIGPTLMAVLCSLWRDWTARTLEQS